ncbi:Phosphoribosyl-AMP cyclohydrolase [Enhygromyxa salina]|uniref:Histidine biosynthesis bifunctional protein HisIE n=1 Tax=Enhygromyxa salina TaxID=215803 RepID=A0A0C2CTN5_9BACT|nr:bifunctional phosphoribosyl-AMP cyclohydrolase/phosphoribosyl-ATP diphosphatase HisIE [Enhygromyxa salina]KIG14526.1 Phosphoribosyl-AMP cyclohydrolase [Enhygromyxa salina]
MPELIPELWSKLAPDASGLVAAIVVNANDDRVLMLGYMNREALAATLSTRKVTFFSRSRRQLWQKGESSGHTLELASIRVDCDGDALLVRAVPRGPTCHTGTTSCFFKTVDLPPLGAHEPVGITGEDDGPGPSAGPIGSLWQTILDRKAGRGLTNRDGKSYVRSLLDGGVERINAKLREEAGELCDALSNETDARVLSEAADLLFHALVGLAARGLEPEQVAAVIRERHGLSGVDEKAQR